MHNAYMQCTCIHTYTQRKYVCSYIFLGCIYYPSIPMCKYIYSDMYAEPNEIL